MTKEAAAASLKTLSQLLEKHYGQKVILRISSCKDTFRYFKDQPLLRGIPGR